MVPSRGKKKGSEGDSDTRGTGAWPLGGAGSALRLDLNDGYKSAKCFLLYIYFMHTENKTRYYNSLDRY